MADRTVRAIFEATVAGARKGMTAFASDVTKTGKAVDDLTKDLKTLDGQKVKPEIDVKIDEAKKRLTDLTGQLAHLKSLDSSPMVDADIERVQAKIKDVRGEIKDLTSQKAEVRVDAQIADAQKRMAAIKVELGELRTMDASPQVSADITDAQKRLSAVKSELRDLSGAKSEMRVTADTSDAESALSGLEDEAGDAGADAGDAAGGNMVSGIVDALGTIPIAGAIVGAGAAIAGGLLLGIQQGLQIEASRDLFSARTGLDEATSARFGRAAGEAYSQAWGDSVESNLETARVALEQGLIDEDAVDAEVEKVIASLSGISEIMQADIPEAARAAGQLIKTGLVKNADEAFDVLVAGYQNGANASEDFLDTLIEYPTHFRDLGLSAQEATGLLIQGMDGGAFNADKVADSLKELTIKVKELDSTAAPALKTLGLNGKEMSAAFAEGGPAARDALDQILTKLAAVEDPAERAKLAVGLFGTQAEDMADALGSLNLDTAAEEIGGIAGAAGAADRALTTMSDNTSSKIESARRNIEVAANGIKGALAEAFSEELDSAADWVSRNREPIIQFFVDVTNGAIEAGKGFAEFTASALDGVAALAEGMAKVLGQIPGMGEAENAMRGLATSAKEGADSIRDNVPSALDEVQGRINSWAGPEILKARVHDAQMAMSADMDAFSAKVNASGGTVTINGDKVNAEQALELLKANINKSDGTVTINGNRVPAEKALDTILGLIAAGKEDVTIGGDDSEAQGELTRLKSKIGATGGSVKVDASTGAAERAINYTARDRSSTIRVNYAYSSSGSVYRSQVPGANNGGWVPGLNAGGWVPGPDPGYDNILWPLNSGGQTLQQPLTGREFVVNSTDAAYWAPELRAMNAGARRGAAQPSMKGLVLAGEVLIREDGTGRIRAVVQDELSSTARSARLQGVSS